MHFEKALEEVFKAEGGLLVSDGEGLKGGGANYGITLGTLREWRADLTLTLDALKALEKEEAAAIYKHRYWDALGLDAVANPWTAIVLMDQAVNRGKGGIRSQLRFTLKKRYGINTEGMGMETMLALVNKIPDVEFARRLLYDSQLAYVEIAIDHPEKLINLRGWLIRTHNILKQMDAIV